MEASGSEKAVYGVDVKLHPVTKMPLETGIGAQSEHQQALAHVAMVTEKEGKEAGEKMAAKLAEHEKKPVKAKARLHAEAMATAADEAEGKGKLARAKADKAKAEADAEEAEAKAPKVIVPKAGPHAAAGPDPVPASWLTGTGMAGMGMAGIPADEARAKADAEAKERAEAKTKAEAAQHF
jgi:colicin import membrane protein